MFTGIVTDIGEVLSISPQGTRGDRRLRIATAYDSASVDLGASIACSGCCLTVIEKGQAGARHWFDVEVSGETLSATVLGAWQPGTRLNLERSLKFGDELGGHIVQGHVDGVAEVVGRRPEGGSLRLEFAVPEHLAHLIAAKGSVAIDGISLTVNEVAGNRFGVNIIPHTQDATTIGGAQPGRRVNLETDMLARYVQRLLQKDR